MAHVSPVADSPVIFPDREVGEEKKPGTTYSVPAIRLTRRDGLTTTSVL